ncbi:MAG: pyridoxamine 5'-phosphate oxidase family protein [Tepidisphaeraceae bacterium]
MGSTFDSITPDLRRFIEAQKMFFVATAPLSRAQHINLSPKGLDCFRVLTENRVGYLDLTGSGNETSAHVEENGRITFMFCAFDGPPKILRLYGRGRTVLPTAAEWTDLAKAFPGYPGARQIIVADIHRAMTSCGFAVPRYEFVEHRDELLKYAEKKGPEGLEQYRRDKNVTSIDALVTALGKERAAS